MVPGWASASPRAVGAEADRLGLRRVLLATRDAHGLYEQGGFTALPRPERYMERTPG